MNTRRSSVGVGVVDGKSDLCVSYLLCHQNENPSFKYVYAVFLTCLCLSVGKLYAVGGYDGASRQCLSTVEEYDPVSNQWCYVAEMGTRRSGAGTATHCILPTVHPHREQHHSSTLSIQEK